MKKFLVIFTVIMIMVPGQSFARHRGLICGATQMQFFGIRDSRYRLARSWLNFPRTMPHSGAVVFQWRNGRDSAGHRGGHVSRIVDVKGRCRATVADDRGTYERDICGRGAVVVDPNGSLAMLQFRG